MQLNLNTIGIFGGKFSENGNLYFSGEIEHSWSILYRDGSNLETENFYKIIAPFDDVMIHHLFFFRSIKEAMLLFQFKKEEYFRNSQIVISGMKTIPFVKSFLLKTFCNESKIRPKFHFFHSPEYFDLVVLYLELLEKDIHYQNVQIEGKSYFNIQYQSINIQLSFDQISKSKICFLLGINDRKFNVRNHFLSQNIINQNLNW